MGSPSSPVPKSLSEREQPYFSVAIRLFGAATITLITVGLIWGAISVHDADSAGTFGWLMAPAVWLMSSAYSKWQKIPVSDRTDPQLNRGRVINRVALGSLVLVIIGTTLTITIALQRRQARSRRAKEILQQTKLDIPAVTQNRLNVQAIMGRDVRTFADFRAQCTDLEVALQQSDALAIKRKQLWDQLKREVDDPNALSLLELYKQIGDADAKATSTLHTMISCSVVLARSDVSQQNKFMSLCVEPAQSELIVSVANENELLKQAKERGAKLPPDLLESLK
jgi:hypothetical protein